jgi:hypothetical protein
VLLRVSYTDCVEDCKKRRVKQQEQVMMSKMKLGVVTAAALLAGTVVASAQDHPRRAEHRAEQSYAQTVVRQAPREFQSGWFHERMPNRGESYIGIQDRGEAEDAGCPC